jgi:hypothetical protein
MECGNTRILDFVEVLNTLGSINQQVRTSSLGTETPDLPRIRDIPTEFIGKETSTQLEIVTGFHETTDDGIFE